jgi:hypothetical protein
VSPAAPALSSADPQLAAGSFTAAVPQSSLPLGIVGGIVAMLLGTAVWVAVTVTTEFQIGYMAVGVGFVVGLGVRFLGKGTETGFRVVAAGLALLGCALGNLLSGCAFVASAQDLSFLNVVSGLNPAMAADILGAMFSPMDLLFYGLAAMAGWKYSVVAG